MLTYELLDSRAWGDLSIRARDIFIRLTRKYNGRNNGNLSLTLSELRAENELKSPATLTKALDDLWRHGFIVLTREGGFSSRRVCNLWVLTTWAIDDIPEKRIIGTMNPLYHWRDWSPGEDAPDYRKQFPRIKKKRERNAPKKNRYIQ